MRIKEFLPENWWQGLDSGFLGMMGYTEETQASQEPATDLVSSVSKDIKKIRQAR